MKGTKGSYMFRKTVKLVEGVNTIMRLDTYATYAEMFRALVRKEAARLIKIERELWRLK